MGPASIESHYDEALGRARPARRRSRAASATGVDGYVIACFGDPGLDAARELAAGPVVGIAEAAMHAGEPASAAGSAWSRRWTAPGPGLGPGRTVRRCERFCGGVHACEIPVLELDDRTGRARSVITEACRARPRPRTAPT